MLSENNGKKSNDCFVLMPIADPDGYEKGHFKKVYDDIFKVACEKAGFKPVRADDVKQTNLIHLDILQKLIDSPMAICDLSSRNPNVLFELGLRQAFDKPTILVQEQGTPPIFDISPLRYTLYRRDLKYREVIEDQLSIADALIETQKATSRGEGINSLISLLSLTNPAKLKEVSDNDTTKMLQVVMSEMSDLKAEFRSTLSDFIRPTGPYYVLEEAGGHDTIKASNIFRLGFPEQSYKSCKSLLQKFKTAVENGNDISSVTKQYNYLKSAINASLNGPIERSQHVSFLELALSADELFNRFIDKHTKR